MKKGNVPWNIGKKGVQTAWNRGKKMSDAARKNMSLAKKGIPRTLAEKANLSRIWKGKRTGASNPRWKGGNRAHWARKHARRRQLGRDTLNEYFEGSDAHHIDQQHIIYIPTKLHDSVRHSLNKPETMERINCKVFCWLLGRIKEDD